MSNALFCIEQYWNVSSRWWIMCMWTNKVGWYKSFRSIMCPHAMCVYSAFGSYQTPSLFPRFVTLQPYYCVVVKTSNYEITHTELCSNQKSAKQLKIHFIFEILQSSHPLPWWLLCTRLAFSQPASWGSHLECISINRCALLKVHLWNFFPS